MRNLIILLVLMSGVTFANAQKVSNKRVPETVKSAFQKNYPKAEELKWEKENGMYEAEFEVDETDYSILIDVSGNIIETEIEIQFEELPANAKAYISKHYSGQKIRETAKLIDSKGVIAFEVEIKGKDLIFDNNGNFLKVIIE